MAKGVDSRLHVPFFFASAAASSIQHAASALTHQTGLNAIAMLSGPTEKKAAVSCVQHSAIAVLVATVPAASEEMPSPFFCRSTLSNTEPTRVHTLPLSRSLHFDPFVFIAPT